MILKIDKYIEAILGLILLLKGHTAFGVTLIVFAFTNINVTLGGNK